MTPESIAVLRRAVDLAPGSARAPLLLALALSERLRSDDDVGIDEVLAALKESARRAPAWAEPHWIRAEVLVLRGERSAATDALAAALELEPDHEPALRLLAEIRLENGDPAAAVRLARRLVTAHPESGDGRLLLGRAQLAQGKPLKALKTLSDDPPSDLGEDATVEWLLTRGRANAGLRHWPSAHEDLTAALQRRPGLVDALFERAEVSRLRGDAAGALQDAVAALASRPEHVEAWGTRGAALSSLGRIAEAKEAFEQALRLDGDYVFGLQLLAQVNAPDDPATARALLDRAIALEPDNRQLQLEEAWLDVTDGQFEQALARFDVLLDVLADSEAHCGRAEALRLLGRPVEAVEAAQAALLLTPDDAQALRSLGFAYLAAGNPDAALAAFRRGSELYPDDVRARVDLAAAYATGEIDELDRAFELLDEACTASPLDPWPLGNLAELTWEMGSYADSIALYRRALAADPSDEAHLDGLGWALQYTEPALLDEAQDVFVRALALKPEDLWLRESLANVLHLRGETDRAAEIYGKLLDQAQGLRSERPDLLELAGWCAFRLGSFTPAARAYLEVLSTTTAATSRDFDLALVLYCDPGSRHGVESYLTAEKSLQHRHELGRRGVLRVALADFRQAVHDHPALADLPTTAQIEDLLTRALASLPPPPAVAILG
jgi:tetratricopeptide (TPR) repeat protein